MTSNACVSSQGGYAIEDLLAAPNSERRTLLELAREEGKSPPTTWRWATKGRRGLRLPTFMVGSVRVTTRPAYHWWVTKLTEIANGEPVSSRTNRQRETAIERAEKELAALGV